MVIDDRVYGRVDILDVALIELIHSAPVQRLKRINQAGVTKYIWPWKDVTRYEHSIGVMLLLRHFGASLEEQVAGLLHDLPHTALSHVADFVFANIHHEFHEQFHESIILESEIKGILQKHSISLNVAFPHNYKLLERSIPDLCADRVDYALRDYFSYSHDRQNLEYKFGGLILDNDEIVFGDQARAEKFALDFLEMDRKAWSDPAELAIYTLVAQAIQHAMDKKILTMEDMFSDDETVMNILHTRGDSFIQKKLGYITPSFRITPATKQHHHLFVKTKVRYVDPKIVQGGKTKRLSEVSVSFKQLLATHMKRVGEGHYIFIHKD